MDERDPQGACRGLERERLRRGGPMGLADRLMQIGRRCAALSDLDKRSPDEIVG
jgi:antitoxin VapB